MNVKATTAGFVMAGLVSAVYAVTSASASPPNATATVGLFATPSDTHLIARIDPSAVSYECSAPSGHGDFALVVREDRSVGYVRVPVKAPGLNMTVTAADLSQCGSPSKP